MTARGCLLIDVPVYGPGPTWTSSRGVIEHLCINSRSPGPPIPSQCGPVLIACETGRSKGAMPLLARDTPPNSSEPIRATGICRLALAREPLRGDFLQRGRFDRVVDEDRLRHVARRTHQADLKEGLILVEQRG